MIILTTVIFIIVACAPQPIGEDPGNGGDGGSNAYGDDISGDYNNDVTSVEHGSLPSYNDEPAQYVQPYFAPGVTAINMLIDEWLGWKPIIDANHGMGATVAGADSLFDIHGIIVNLEFRHSTALTSDAIVRYFLSGEFNAIGMTVEQFANVYHELSSQGFEARMIFTPANSTRWGAETRDAGVFIGGVVVDANLLYEARWVNGFVSSVLRATFGYTYTHINDRLERQPNFDHVRSMDFHSGASDEELLERLRDISFYDRRHNLLVLYDRNIAENIFHAVWSSRHGSSLPRPQRGDIIDVGPLRSIQLPAGYTFHNVVVETVYIVVYFDEFSYEIQETERFEQDITMLVNDLSHRGELNLRVYGFVSMAVGATVEAFTRDDIALNRAIAVMDRIVERGIDSSRLEAIMGGPLFTQEGEARYQNRVVRIEYVR